MSSGIDTEFNSLNRWALDSDTTSVRLTHGGSLYLRAKLDSNASFLTKIFAFLIKIFTEGFFKPGPIKTGLFKRSIAVIREHAEQSLQSIDYTDMKKSADRLSEELSANTSIVSSLRDKKIRARGPLLEQATASSREQLAIMERTLRCCAMFEDKRSKKIAQEVAQEICEALLAGKEVSQESLEQDLREEIAFRREAMICQETLTGEATSERLASALEEIGAPLSALHVPGWKLYLTKRATDYYSLLERLDNSRISAARQATTGWVSKYLEELASRFGEASPSEQEEMLAKFEAIFRSLYSKIKASSADALPDLYMSAWQSFLMPSQPLPRKADALPSIGESANPFEQFYHTARVASSAVLPPLPRLTSYHPYEPPSYDEIAAVSKAIMQETHVERVVAGGPKKPATSRPAPVRKPAPTLDADALVERMIGDEFRL